MSPPLRTSLLLALVGCGAADVAVPPTPPHPAVFDTDRWALRADPAPVSTRATRGLPDWPAGLAPVASPAIAARSREPVPETTGGGAHGR